MITETPPKVSPYKTKLDRVNAYWMATIAKAVYEKQSDTNQHPNEKKILQDLQAIDPSFVSVHGADNNTAQAALIEHEDYFCIAFRGTNELKDWLDNINAFPVKQLFGEFHRGFWQSVEDIWETVYQQYRKLNETEEDRQNQTSTESLERNKQKKRPLFLTGHSLGGAMATIAAARLIHLDLPFTSVYTFGQPRTMTHDTAQIFNMECKERFFRFHNNNDLVTRVPARVIGYSHVGIYLYIAGDKSINRELGLWLRFLDYVEGAVEAAQEEGLDGIEDHNMDAYLEAITKWDLQE